MFGFAWLAIRQSREALKQGRLEEACRLLTQPTIREHRAAGELVAAAGPSLCRSRRTPPEDDGRYPGRSRDLLQAEQLQTAEKCVDRLRQSLIRLGVSEVRALLQAGDVRRADEAIAHLRERRAHSAELQVLEEATRDWLQARELADHGEFAAARDALERAFVVACSIGLPRSIASRTILSIIVKSFRDSWFGCTKPPIRASGARSSPWRSRCWPSRRAMRRRARCGRWPGRPSSQ